MIRADEVVMSVLKGARSTKRLRRGSKPSSPRPTHEHLSDFPGIPQTGHWLQNDRCDQRLAALAPGQCLRSY